MHLCVLHNELWKISDFFCGQWPGLGSSYPCSNVVKLRGVSEDSVNSEDPYVHLSVFRALTVYGPCT